MTAAITAGCLVLCASACASALGEPSPLAVYAPGHANGRSAAQLVVEGSTAWARRSEPGQAELAQGLFLDAAVVDPHRVDALLGAMRAVSYRIEYEPNAPRAKLAAEGVAIGQWCKRRASAVAECDYRLAIAIGQQARERPSTGRDALDKMTELLHHTIAVAPRLDDGGPHRVLALVFLKAPAWPLGPGDAGAGLEQAYAAARVAPDSAANQLVLGDALTANGRTDEARVAYLRAARLAAAGDARDAEVARQQAQARAGLAKIGG